MGSIPLIGYVFDVDNATVNEQNKTMAYMGYIQNSKYVHRKSTAYSPSDSLVVGLYAVCLHLCPSPIKPTIVPKTPSCSSLKHPPATL